jgi:hypothetical protein
MGEEWVDLWRIGVSKSWFEWLLGSGFENGAFIPAFPPKTRTVSSPFTNGDLNDAGPFKFYDELKYKRKTADGMARGLRGSGQHNQSTRYG